MKYHYLLLLALVALVPAQLHAGSTNTQILQWQSLPELPDALGVAGAFSGLSSGALIVAGGANFPEPLFKNGQVNPLAKKIWWDRVYVLDRPNSRWQEAAPLPRPLAYGASVNTADGLVCIGGCDAETHYAGVFLLEWVNEELKRTILPALPRPCAYTAACLLDTTIYVAGGQESPGAKQAMNNFWALDISQDEPRWQEVEPWPGPERILPVVAVQDGSFFIFSGCKLLAEEDGKVSRNPNYTSPR